MTLWQLLFLTAACWPGGAVAQPMPLPTPAPMLAPVADVPAAPDDGTQIQPFDIDASRRMAVPVMVGDQGPFSFLVDTGAERSVISRELADRLALPRGAPLRLATISGLATAPSYRVASLSLADLRLDPFDAPALYGRNIGAAGLIGVDMLQGHRVLIDFRRETMRMTPVARRARAIIRDDDAIVVSARNRAGRLILSDGRVEGRRVFLIVDTGAQTSIGNLALMRLVTARRAHRGGASDVSLTAVTGASVTAQQLVLRAITVEELTLNDLPVSFTDADAFRALGLADQPAMLLGMDALRLFDRLEIDYVNNRIIFDPPAMGSGPSGARYAAAHRAPTRNNSDGG